VGVRGGGAAGLGAAREALRAAKAATAQAETGWAGTSRVTEVEQRVFYLAFAQTWCGPARGAAVAGSRRTIAPNRCSGAPLGAQAGPDGD
jgi:hypothetical protein